MNSRDTFSHFSNSTSVPVTALAEISLLLAASICSSEGDRISLFLNAAAAALGPPLAAPGPPLTGPGGWPFGGWTIK
jgi:hypothetical protein